MKMRDLQRNTLVSLGIMLFVFAILFVLNYLTWYTSDDYAYRYVFQPMPSESMERVDGIGSIIRSQIIHYNTWNGRFIAHSVVQFFMQFDKIIFNIFNSLAFVLLGFLVFCLVSSVTGKKCSNRILILVYLLLWLLIPSFGQTVLWVSGSGNYLWMSLLYIAFILFITKQYNTSAVTVISAIVLGFLAGATNENSGPAAIMIASLFVLYECIVHKRISAWKILGVVACAVGSYMIITAPGAQRFGGIIITSAVIKSHFINAFNVNVQLFALAYVLLACVLTIILDIKRVGSFALASILILMLGHFAAIYSLIFSPYIANRTLFGSAVFLVSSIAIAISYLDGYKYFNRACLFLLSLISLAYIYFAFSDIYKSHTEVAANIKLIEKASPGSDVDIKMLSNPKTTYNPYYGTSNVNTNSASWFNSWMATYYDVRSITGHR